VMAGCTGMSFSSIFVPADPRAIQPRSRRAANWRSSSRKFG
jgi:hypothetical protein